MIIQFNTDKTIRANERQKAYFSSLIEEELNRFSEHITRIEVHLSDENGNKDGVNDVRCLLEARVEGRQPLAVTSYESSQEKAVSGAIEKIKTTLSSMKEHLKKY